MSLWTLDEFIKEGKKASLKYGRNGNARSYINHPGFEGLYLRFGTRYFNGILYPDTLDIANVTVEEDRRGTGVFKGLIAHLLEKYPGLHLFAESVLEKRLRDGLQRMGFVPVHIHYSFFLESTHAEARVQQLEST